MTLAPAPAVALVTLAAVLLVMAGEAVLSRVNEQGLRRRGAVEPPGDVYRTMQWAYPALFVAMAVEGATWGPSPRAVLLAGLVVFGAAKALKLWAITSLGDRWSFRVLVLPGVPLVESGPYRWMRHPNYLAVVGELLGVALTVWAPVAGLAALVGFGALMLRRIAVEERALEEGSER
ncbi:MAG: isoprenylcysteine carboxylmethyltransferase family protein [Vicinamibacterales bacterium]